MVFFALTVAPTVFKVLSAEHAGTFLRAFFPVYYLWGLVMALFAAGVAIEVNSVVSVVLLLIALLFVFARQTLMPLINHARDDQLRAKPGAARRFKILHVCSVLINGLQILMLLVAGGMVIKGVGHAVWL
jgi:hypothetical protein